MWATPDQSRDVLLGLHRAVAAHSDESIAVLRELIGGRGADELGRRRLAVGVRGEPRAAAGPFR